MNDRAELVAVFLAAEAIEAQTVAFPNGAEVGIDDLAVCDTCRVIAPSCPIRSTRMTDMRISPLISGCSMLKLMLL